MAYYSKTEHKFLLAKESENREAINNIFENFVRNNHDTNFSFLYQRAIKLFGNQITKEQVEDQIQDIYFTMLLYPEEQLLQMTELDLIKIFRFICNSPVTTGAFFQKLKNSTHENIDDYDL